MDVQELNNYSFSLLNYTYNLQLKEQALHFLVTNNANYQKYRAHVNHQTIKTNKNLQFFFNSPQELFSYFKNNCGNQLQLTKNGQIYFVVQTNLGKSIKSFECLIETVKQEIQPQERMKFKLQKLDKEVQSLKVQNDKLKSKNVFHQSQIKEIKKQVEECLKIISVKDQIITSIFKELKNITDWKQEHQRNFSIRSIKRKFIADDSNPHNKKFQQIGNRFKKTIGGSWDILMCKYPLQKNEVYQYHIKQVKAGANGSFMYGIATEAVKGTNRAQDSKEFIGYYQNTGFLFQNGESKKSGPKIKDGETITIQVDLNIWKITWYIQGRKQAESSISKQLKQKALFLSIVIFNQQSEIQFL